MSLPRLSGAFCGAAWSCDLWRGGAWCLASLLCSPGERTRVGPCVRAHLVCGSMRWWCVRDAAGGVLRCLAYLAYRQPTPRAASLRSHS
eukprot:6838462-Prymnesium_polylepis.1